ncbi:Amine oxidase [Handroanthus impetiginosus]|uniref:Amine oxidase n=1 Tax=Handroanthus impetiginosus TaxID=429701 RepID=A0A2G9HNT1_9LAMI|nr:Amine oxidase [Handroanthus impetiginosus]
MLACWRARPVFSKGNRDLRRGFCCRAEDQTVSFTERQNKKKVVIAGSGWAGFGAAHHLCKQGFDVTVLEGGYELGPKTKSLSPDDAGIRGFWYPYRNIFNLVDELDLKPFTSWIKSAQYSLEGLEVEYPIFQDSPQLPTPFGTLLNTQFVRLPFIDRLTSLPLTAAVIDFDNTDTAWRKYDPITARELLKQFGCSERLYRDVFDPLLQVGLFAPAEQCSAAAALGMINYFILANQKHFDLVLCRGTLREKIFQPWIESLKSQGCRFLDGREVTDVVLNEETGCISEVICEKESFKTDALILAIGISTLQEIIQNSAALCGREEFLKVMKLNSTDLLTVKLWLDRKVNVPYASSISCGFDDYSAWTFFDLSTIYDEYKDSTSTIIQADLYNANDLLPLKDEKIVEKVMSWLSKCIKEFESASVVDKEIGRFPKFHTHFFPGSYKYMMRGSTSFPNLYMAGDWIVNRHGSWLEEKSLVSGLEAANRVVDYLEEGSFARIIPVQEDQPHIQSLRSLNRNLYDLRSQLPWSNYFLQ